MIIENRATVAHSVVMSMSDVHDAPRFVPEALTTDLARISRDSSRYSIGMLTGNVAYSVPNFGEGATASELSRSMEGFVLAIALAMSGVRASPAIGEPLTFGVSNAAQPSSGVSMRKEAWGDAIRRCLLEREITSYAQLECDWDCDGGHAPARVDIDNALAFLRSLPGGDIPRPMVAGDGDVGFIWKTESSYLEVGFCDKGQISFYGKTASGEKAGGDNDFAQEGVSDNLRKLLEKIANVPRND